MPKDKYKATWVSHSSMSDFLKCPRSYYLRNVYKNPDTRHKISVVSPALSLGIAVHAVLENLAHISLSERSQVKLEDLFDKEWEKYQGRRGGFTSNEQENDFKNRGIKMLRNVSCNIEPLLLDTVFMAEELPKIWFSDENNIILSGKVDWISRRDDGIHIIDFKTGKNEEKDDSLQLPIYAFLARAILKESNINISYWYIDYSESPTPMKIPNLKEAYNNILQISLNIKAARETGHMDCPKNGCYACRDYEKVLTGDAEYVGLGEYDKDLYFVD